MWQQQYISLRLLPLFSPETRDPRGNKRVEARANYFFQIYSSQRQFSVDQELDPAKIGEQLFL